MRRWLVGMALCCLFAGGLHGERRQAAPAGGGTPPLAPAPPLGWNSWDSYGLRIGEAEFRANATAMASRLKSSGYTYVVIDEGWYMVNPEDRPRPQQLQYAVDAYGRFIPVPVRFASAVQAGTNSGFTSIATWIHGQGLKFGLHIVRGIPRVSVARNLPIEGSTFAAEDAADQTDACSWDPTSWGIKDNAAGQAWYDALLRQYAAWGVDFVKVDCIANNPYKVSEIRQIHQAIQRSGRDMILSLSPGPTALAHQAEVAELAQMWRISNDIWDLWDSHGSTFPIGVGNQFDNAAKWAAYAGPGHWPDADMLPVGELRPSPDVGPGPRHTRLTVAEQQTQLSLWAMVRSPLIIGGNLTLLDDDTGRLLTNPDILHIDQTATASRQVLHEGNLIAWTADLPNAEHAIAVFNVGDTPLTFDWPFARLGLSSGPHDLRQAWSGARTAAASDASGTIDPHASLVFMLRN